MIDPRNDSAFRWAAAAQMAAGVTDDGFHRRRTRIVVRLVAIIIGTWIAGFVIALLFLPKTGAHHTSNSGPTDQQLIVEFVFLGLGLAVGIGGFIWARRTGHYITRWRSVASPLNWQEKKSVRRQISGKDQLDQEHLRVVVAIAKQNRRATLGVAPIYSAMVLIAVGEAAGSDEVYIKLLELTASLLFVFAAVILTVQYRRAGRFIDRHVDADQHLAGPNTTTGWPPAEAGGTK